MGDKQIQNDTTTSVDDTATVITEGATAVASETEPAEDAALADTTKVGDDTNKVGDDNVSRETSAEQDPADEKPAAEPFSRQFATLTKKDRQLRERELGLKTREQNLASREEAVKELLGALEGKDPKALLKIAEARGVTFKQMAEAVVDDGQPATPEKLIASMQQEIAALKDEIAAGKNADAQTRTQEVFNAVKKDIGSHLETNKESYELTLALFEPREAREEVFAVIEEAYETHNKILSVKEAADLLEKHLEDNVERFSKTKKLSSRFGATAKGGAETPTEKGNEKPLTQQTLTQNLVSQAGMKSGTDGYLSEAESKALMARMIEESLQ